MTTIQRSGTGHSLAVRYCDISVTSASEPEENLYEPFIFYFFISQKISENLYEPFIFLIFSFPEVRPRLVVYGVRVQNKLHFAYPYSVRVFCIATRTEYVYRYEIKFRTNFFCTKLYLQFVHLGKVYRISLFWKFSILLHLIIAPSHCNNRSEPTTSQQVVDKSSRVS